LRDLQYVEGQTVFIEWGFADRQPGRLQELATQMVQKEVDVIVAYGTVGVRAAQQATKKIPIVMPGVADALGSGLVTSLARPNGNTTGTSFLGTELVAKRLELLKAALPNVSRVAVLRHPGAHGERTAQRMREETEQAARTMELELRLVDVRASSEYKTALAAIKRASPSALLVWPSPMFLADRKRIVDAVASERLPAMYYLREYVDSGGLMSYGPNHPALVRRAATYVDKLLKGAKPADLPIEEPTKFDFIVNVRTANSLGITVPQSILVRADEVIQ
jgi:putative ABC transport system substrate-binding protein